MADSARKRRCLSQPYTLNDGLSELRRGVVRHGLKKNLLYVATIPDLVDALRGYDRPEAAPEEEEEEEAGLFQPT